MSAPDVIDAVAKAMCIVETRSKAASLEEVQAGIQRWTRHRYEAERLIEELTDGGVRVALSTPPADDVREALTAARNVERYIDMLALDADDRVHVVIDDGYDGDGVIQSLEVPDLRTLIAFVREVRPHGTVTDASVIDLIRSHWVLIRGAQMDMLNGRPDMAAMEEIALASAGMDALLFPEAAREVHP